MKIFVGPVYFNMPSDISRVFPYFHVGGLSTGLEKYPLLKSPNASDGLESVGIFSAALCSCHIREPPHRRKGMLSECSLHPRGCTTHSPSLPDSHIHQSSMKYENSPRRSQFLQAFDPASATCEEPSRAEPSSGNIKLVTIGALSISIQSHAKADYVAMCVPHVGMF